MIFKLAVTLLLFLSGINIAAQSASTWVEIVDDKLGFAIAMPDAFLVDNEEQKDWFLAPVLASLPDVKYIYEKPVLYGRISSVWMQVRVRSIRQTSRAKDHLWMYVRFAENKYPYQDFNVGKYVGRKVTMDDGDKLNTYVTVAVGTKIISIQASADQIDRTVYESFLRSLTLEGNRIFGGNVDQLANKRVQLDQLQTSPEIASALTVKDAKGDFVEARPLSEFVPEPESLNKPTRPVLVLRQPRKFLDLPPAGKFTGLLKAKVLFRSDGTIGTIELFSDIPKQMQRNVYKEIQKIKFLPAQISGQNVDHLKVIEYSFNSK